MPPVETRLMLNQEQLAQLSTPVRAEIVEAMRLLGPASAGEIAAHMGRSPQSLYYHLRQLTDVGLVRVCDTRRAIRRPESVYELAAERFAIELKEGDAGLQPHAAEAVSAVLRKVTRDFRRASASRSEGTVVVIRAHAHLPPEAAARVEELLEEVAQIARQHEDPQQGARYSLLMLLYPVPRRPDG